MVIIQFLSKRLHRLGSLLIVRIMTYPRIRHLSENSLIMDMSEKLDAELCPQIAALAEAARNELTGVIESVPCATLVYIEFNPLEVDPTVISERLHAMFSNISGHALNVETVTLPCYYSPDVAPDLLALAEQKKMTFNELISIHSGTTYTVCSIGFAPGFAYLGGLDPRICADRHSTPRQSVASGSVGIAGAQTAVYPRESPGGWQIIGNCPLTLFDIQSDPISPLSHGMQVRFEPIDRQTFIQKGGKLP